MTLSANWAPSPPNGYLASWVQALQAAVRPAGSDGWEQVIQGVTDQMVLAAVLGSSEGFADWA